MRNLQTSDKGNLLPTVTNAQLMLEYAPGTRPYRLNDFTLCFETRDEGTGEWRKLTDRDYLLARVFLEGAGLMVGSDVSVSALHLVAGKHHAHPVRDYLRGLKWDGTPRLERLFINYFKAEDTPLHREIGKRFAIGAVARIFIPGCKLDNYPVLEGLQGLKKSTALKALTGPWFSDTRLDLNKGADAYMPLQGVWIYEVAELDSFKGASSTRLKSFVSSSVDRFRPPYGRTVQDVPRQSIFAATTNDSDYVTDWTGDRRKWPVAVSAVDVELIERDRDQLWAEAVRLFDAGERWHLEGAAAAEMVEAAKLRYDQDVLIEEIADMLNVHKDKLQEEMTIGDLFSALNLETQKGGGREQSRAIRALRSLGFLKLGQKWRDGAPRNLWKVPDVFLVAR